MKSMCFASISIVMLCAIAQAGGPAPTAEETKPLKAGESAPSGSFYDESGKEVSLQSLYEEFPLILVYYRGDWCRFCNLHLRGLKTVEPKLQDLGYTLVAASADKPEILKRTEAKEDLPYRLLSDSSMEMAEKFGIAFKLSEETQRKYKEYEIDLAGASGHDHGVLPVPSVFLIDRSGKILWSYSDPDYSNRLQSEELLAAAEEHAAK